MSWPFDMLAAFLQDLHFCFPSWGMERQLFRCARDGCDAAHRWSHRV